MSNIIWICKECMAKLEPYRDAPGYAFNTDGAVGHRCWPNEPTFNCTSTILHDARCLHASEQVVASLLHSRTPDWFRRFDEFYAVLQWKGDFFLEWTPPGLFQWVSWFSFHHWHRFRSLIKSLQLCMTSPPSRRQHPPMMRRSHPATVVAKSPPWMAMDGWTCWNPVNNGINHHKPP